MSCRIKKNIIESAKGLSVTILVVVLFLVFVFTIIGIVGWVALDVLSIPMHFNAVSAIDEYVQVGFMSIMGVIMAIFSLGGIAFVLGKGWVFFQETKGISKIFGMIFECDKKRKGKR